MFARIQKFSLKYTVLAAMILALFLAILKYFLPREFEFIEPSSLYGSLLASVIFVYGFIISPTVAEYKESERMTVELKNHILTLEEDYMYFSQIQNISTKNMLQEIKKLKQGLYDFLADHKESRFLESFPELSLALVPLEQAGIPANHIIRAKQELSHIRRIVFRLIDIKEKDSLPQMIHSLKNFLVFFVILALMGMKFHDDTTTVHWIVSLQEGLMLFMISFLYLYLSFIITGLENPFDKRRFSGYIDLSFLLHK